MIDSLCFFCDYIEHTSASKDIEKITQLTQKYIEIASSKHGEDENVAHTVAYALGEFGYLLPKQNFAPFLAFSVSFLKKAILKPDAFEEDLLITTENSLGALAKISYT